jgi:hypothetical protein
MVILGLENAKQGGTQEITEAATLNAYKILPRLVQLATVVFSTKIAKGKCTLFSLKSFFNFFNFSLFDL